MGRTCQLSPIVDLSPLLGEGTLVALNIGPDQQIYVVIALKAMDYSIERSGATFPKIRPEAAQAYRVLALHEGQVTLDLHIPHEPLNIHNVQPLPGNELLLVCGRSAYRGRGDFDRNGRVYSTDGQFARELLLGDGIEDVQTTLRGVIWTSFFDEGVFGNFGWSNPVGAAGLVAWNVSGDKLYEYQPSTGLDSICDCYALNVESDSSTWLYYYTDFPLVHLRNRRVEAWWQMPLGGSDGFAVSRGMTLFRGGYNARDVYYLFELSGSGAAKEVKTCSLADENGKPLIAERVVGRADALYLLNRSRIYRCTIADVATV